MALGTLFDNLSAPEGMFEADAAELVLVALGLPREEARAMAGAEIPAGAASGQ